MFYLINWVVCLFNAFTNFSKNIYRGKIVEYGIRKNYITINIFAHLSIISDKYMKRRNRLEQKRKKNYLSRA